MCVCVCVLLVGVTCATVLNSPAPLLKAFTQAVWDCTKACAKAHTHTTHIHACCHAAMCQIVCHHDAGHAALLMPALYSTMLSACNVSLCLQGKRFTCLSLCTALVCAVQVCMAFILTCTALTCLRSEPRACVMTSCVLTLCVLCRSAWPSRAWTSANGTKQSAC